MEHSVCDLVATPHGILRWQWIGGKFRLYEAGTQWLSHKCFVLSKFGTGKSHSAML